MHEWRDWPPPRWGDVMVRVPISPNLVAKSKDGEGELGVSGGRSCENSHLGE